MLPPSPNKRYYYLAQPPIFIILLLTAYILLAIRTRVFLPTRTPWLSIPGLSILLLLFVVILLTVYVALLFSILANNAQINNVYMREIPGESVSPNYERDPINFSSGEIRELQHMFKRTAEMIFAGRFVLVVALWFVKIAFLGVFWGMKEGFTRSARGWLGGVTFVVLAGTVVGAWLSGKDMIPVVVPNLPSEEGIRWVEVL